MVIYKSLLKIVSRVQCICDPLSENPASLHNSVFEINAIEIHWVKNTYYKNNIISVLIASVNSDGRLELKSLIDHRIRLFMKSKNIFVSCSYREGNMCYPRLFPLR